MVVVNIRSKNLRCMIVFVKKIFVRFARTKVFLKRKKVIYGTMNLSRQKRCTKGGKVKPIARSPLVGVGVGLTYYNAWAGNGRTRTIPIGHEFEGIGATKKSELQS